MPGLCIFARFKPGCRTDNSWPEVKREILGRSARDVESANNGGGTKLPLLVLFCRKDGSSLPAQAAAPRGVNPVWACSEADSKCPSYVMQIAELCSAASDLLTDSSGSSGKLHAASTTSSSRPLAWMHLQL